MTDTEHLVTVDRAAKVTTRMATPAECARGYPEGPVLVVTDRLGTRVHPHWVTLAFSEPHGQPEPDAVQQAAAYVLGVIGEDLDLLGTRIADLAGAFSLSPCRVAHMAGEVREERAAEWARADLSACSLAAPAASAT